MDPQHSVHINYIKKYTFHLFCIISDVCRSKQNYWWPVKLLLIMLCKALKSQLSIRIQTYYIYAWMGELVVLRGQLQPQ